MGFRHALRAVSLADLREGSLSIDDYRADVGFLRVLLSKFPPAPTVLLDLDLPAGLTFPPLWTLQYLYDGVVGSSEEVLGRFDDALLLEVYRNLLFALVAEWRSNARVPVLDQGVIDFLTDKS